MSDMRHIALAIAAAAFAVQAPIKAQVDPKIAEFCLKAQDFQGCVNSMTGKSSDNKETKVTVDLDKIRTTGNFCPSSYGYVGAGYCERIICVVNYSGHDYRLGGKGWSCKGGNTLQFDGTPLRATTDERCPLEEPEIGKQNSCQNGLTEEQIKQGYGNFRIKPQELERSFGFGFKQDAGAREITLNYVEVDCAAYKAGLRKGDLITEINGKMLPKYPEITNEFLRDQLTSKRVVPVSYKRFDEVRRAKLDPGACKFKERRVVGRQNPQTGQWEELK